MREADAEDIPKAGEDFLLALYGASSSQCLDDFTITAFRKKNAKKSTKTVFQMASLSPTCVAAHQHSFRTCCQVSSGWKMTLIQPNGDGFCPMHHSGQFQQICPQRQIKCCTSCRAAAGLAAVVAAAVDEHKCPVPTSAIVWG